MNCIVSFDGSSSPGPWWKKTTTGWGCPAPSGRTMCAPIGPSAVCRVTVSFTRHDRTGLRREGGASRGENVVPRNLAAVAHGGVADARFDDVLVLALDGETTPALDTTKHGRTMLRPC